MFGTNQKRRAEKARIESEVVSLCAEVIGDSGLGLNIAFNDPKDRVVLAKLVKPDGEWLNVIFSYDDIDIHRANLAAVLRSSADRLLASATH